MPIRSPLSLGLALAALALAPSGTRAEPPAGTWTDPPARSTAPPRTETAPERSAKPSARTADGAAPERVEPVVKKKSVRAARTVAPRRAVAARPVKRPESVVRSATVRPIRVARPLHRDWPPASVVVRAPDPYRPVQVYDPRDPRLERLWSAEDAGYLAVRGRHVAYPDGRVLRIYRPSGDEEDLD